MKIAAVIAEYNPFHNGHAYQLRQIREHYGYDFIIVVMSGDFTQRGAPAITDKHTRAQMALLGGADLVIELPSYYACASAEYFATGAVSLLDGLSCVDALFFGSESEDTDSSCPDSPALLLRAADILLQEPAAYRLRLSESLKSGQGFAAARMNALTDVLQSKPEPARQIPFSESCTAADMPPVSNRAYEHSADTNVKSSLSAVLSMPNNTLGMEYCKAILRLKSPVKPFAIKRIGSGYHDNGTADSFSSAEAVRALLMPRPAKESLTPGFEDALPPDSPILHGASSFADTGVLTRLEQLVPSQTAELLSAQYRAHTLIHPDDFSDLLHYGLLLHEAHLERFADCTPELANRICSMLPSLLGEPVSEMVGTIKTKAYTYTRISRALTHVLLSMTTENLSAFTDADAPAFLTHARILGFRRSACGTLLSVIKGNARIPIITKPAAYRPSGPAAALYGADLLTSHIYQGIEAKKAGLPFRNELTRTPLIIP